MRALETVSRPDFLVCPICEMGSLEAFGGSSTPCDSCGCLLSLAVAEVLEEIVGLPDALAGHACECGHPEMRHLPGGIYRCPVCGVEVLPVEKECENCR